MPIRLITPLQFLFFLCSCSQNAKPRTSAANLADTTVIKRPIIDELPGSAHRKRATSYSLIIDSDTSKLECFFMESKKGGVGFEISFTNTKSYKRQFIELQSILKFASNEYIMDSLGGAFFYLDLTDDLAIDLTKQLSNDDIKNVTNNWSTAKFLLRSKLTSDLNSLLAPYKKQVKQYAIEHPMLIDTIYLKLNYIETPKERIPAKILDGTIWVYFKPNSDK